jgi:hypothetical protein
MFQMAFEMKPPLTRSLEFGRVQVKQRWQVNGTLSPSHRAAHQHGTTLNDTDDALELLIV